MNKYLIKIYGLLIVAVAMVGCEEELVVDDVTNGTTRGAVLRTITPIAANEIAVGAESSEVVFDVTLEEQDAQNGDLLESVDVFATFTDNSPDNGDTTGATVGSEVLLRSIPASEWTDGPFGLPRYNLVITAGDFYSAFGLAGDNIFGGDNFTTRLQLNLTDGRTFSVNNAGSIITGGFFNSPFQYITPTVCPVEADEFVGAYALTSQTPGVLGFNVFASDLVADISAGDTSVDRMFMYQYLPDAGVGQGPVPFRFQLVCNTIIIPNAQPTGLQCSSGLLVGPAPSGTLGSYTTGDDSVFTLVFTDNINSDCGEGPVDVTAVFTKQ
ncbi:hypothetical protein [Altibacter sp. HG106]|uniref:hypothetical protein n=1 Tax=Altibacter sp. HG106 TaxID=3023937 RepID=UPI0023505510|nr:hypothetical protein [Altibacter sp. HG106]MDC7995984.1 hypothetical protein [Altibacter sp. HG106]